MLNIVGRTCYTVVMFVEKCVFYGRAYTVFYYLTVYERLRVWRRTRVTGHRPDPTDMIENYVFVTIQYNILEYRI